MDKQQQLRTMHLIRKKKTFLKTWKHNTCWQCFTKQIELRAVQRNGKFRNLGDFEKMLKMSLLSHLRRRYSRERAKHLQPTSPGPPSPHPFCRRNSHDQTGYDDDHHQQQLTATTQQQRTRSTSKSQHLQQKSRKEAVKSEHTSCAASWVVVTVRTPPR